MARRAVFVDTWAWVAVAVNDDADHARAVVLASELRSQRIGWVTSNFVLAEALTRLRYDASHSMAVALADTVAEMADAGSLQVVVVDERLWSSALTWFRRFDDQRFSLVDCTSFATMQLLGLQEALTADRHFATAGFVPLGA